jgi:hypothetical protein
LTSFEPVAVAGIFLSRIIAEGRHLLEGAVCLSLFLMFLLYSDFSPDAAASLPLLKLSV